MSKEYDVLIVGAGMVGAAVGCALGQQGLRVALFDKALPAPFQASIPPDLRVSALSPASENILQQLGVWESVQAMRSCPYRRMAVWEKLVSPFTGKQLDSRANQTVFDCRDLEYPQLGHIIENRVIQLGLHKALDELDSVDLICPAEPVALDLCDSDRPELTLADGRHYRGKVIVGADGAHSRVRGWASLGMNSDDYEQSALVSTVEITSGTLDITWQAFTATGPLALLPLPDVDGRSYASLVWYNKTTAVRRLAKLCGADFLQELKNVFPSELPEIINLHQRGWFPLTRRHAQKYARDGVVLVGDAAHTINPLAGQGVNLGFLDAAMLAEVLAEASRSGESLGSMEVLKRYEMNRKPANHKMQLVMDGFYHAFSNEFLPLKIIRNAGLGAAGKLLQGQKKVMRYAMGLDGPLPKLARGEQL